MSDLKTTGKIVSIKEATVRGEWTSCLFTIEIAGGNPEWPKSATFEVSNKIDAEYDNVANLSKYNKVGDMVDVDFAFDGFGFTDKETKEKRWANKLKAWRVRKAETVQAEEPDAIEESLEDSPF